MQHTVLADLLTTSPAVQLLRMRNAQWVLPFLYRTFKADNTFSIPEPLLTSTLAEELRTHAEGTEDLEEARIEFGEDEESRARKYLLNWVQKRVLQDFPDADAMTHYQLSTHTEKVFQWLQSLEKRQFVGTESRFRFLFQTLREMAEYTQDNSLKRLEELKNKRAEIDKEIKKLEMGHKPEVFSNAQVQERLDWFTRLSYELLSDFREVEDNFKQIHRSIVEQHTRAEASKGAIVGFAFGAYDELRRSDQGKSFYAFWDFLISRSGQEEWRNLTEHLLQLLDDRAIDTNRPFLQNIKSLLLQQGRTVYDANDKMAEKLSRIITEKEIARHRRLRQQIGSIKELVFQLMDEDKVPCGLPNTLPAEIRLPLERRLNLQPKQAPPVAKQPGNAVEQVADLERFNRMLGAQSVDKKKLWEKVEQVLEKRKTATLREIIDDTGLEFGMSEVVTYFSFLKEKSTRVQAMPEITELVPLNKEKTRFVEIPYLLFSR
ncbi:MAG: DUF3375 domain-containing protein [Candidatus Pseudobacter hemicellulosilyticus]|uniref:DUF3375 domain-containing protein n=1 Tax=Candidatus Pseudobacter hemicellulosilyticus TaxID=3121375 RepID=A0AAJ5WPH6_9BACT|nr:MAG: DUF3375 domain-containing protein [Pseudobacter sp.]